MTVYTHVVVMTPKGPGLPNALNLGPGDSVYLLLQVHGDPKSDVYVNLRPGIRISDKCRLSESKEKPYFFADTIAKAHMMTFAEVRLLFNILIGENVITKGVFPEIC